MKNEAEFKEWFLRKLSRGIVVDVVNIDTSDNPGIPDTNYVHRGVEGWIEFKWLPAKVRPKQLKWFRHRSRSLGKCYLVWGYMARSGYVRFGVIRGENVEQIEGQLSAERAKILSFARMTNLIDGHKDDWLWEPIKEELLTRNSR